MECDPSGPVVKFPTVDITTKLEKLAFSVYSPDLKCNIAERIQIPVKPAFALTIHKAQGMTLPRVEIDCRQIFLPGQLGVGIGRVTSKDGLRVINFSRNACPPQSHDIDEFILSASKREEANLLCCHRERLDKERETGAFTFTPSEIQAVDRLCCSDDTSFHEEFQIDDDEDEFDEGFNEFIACHIDDDFSDMSELPQGFDMNDVLNNLIIEHVLTPVQAEVNDVIKLLLRKEYTSKVKSFCNKEFSILGELMEVLSLSSSDPEPVKASKLAEFYTKCHDHQTSSEMRCNAMLMFINLPSPVSSQVSGHICYNLHVAVRKHLLQEKEKLFTILGRGTSQRHITPSSRGKVRYVGGYCVAKVRYKYIKLQFSNCYKTSPDAQVKYEQACGVIKLLDHMRESEQNLEETSEYLDTLLETAKKQNVSRSLMNISDNMYSFFMKVCEWCLELLVEKNINIHGDQLYKYCSSVILDSKELFELFVKTVSSAQMQDLSSESSVCSLLNDIVSIVVHTEHVYKELVSKFLLVMLNQFRKAFLQALSVEKRMAHRKQIQVKSQKVQTSHKIDFAFVLNDKSEGKSVSHNILKGMILKDKNFLTSMTKNQLSSLSKAYNIVPLSKDTKANLVKKLNTKIISENSMSSVNCLVPLQQEPEPSHTPESSREPEPGPSREPEPGPSREPEPGPSREPELGLSPEPEPGPTHEPELVPCHEPEPGPSHEPEPGSSIPVSNIDYVLADEPGPSAVEQDEDECKICMSERSDDWICCEGCDCWFHRKCAGLSNILKWKKYKKKNVKFFCKDCQ